MRNSWITSIYLGLSTVILITGSMLAFGEEPKRNWQVSTSASYSSGDFGSSSTTESVYVPFRVKRFFSRGSISLTIPYVSITSNRSVTFVGGDTGGGEFEDNGGGNSGSGGGGNSGSGGGGNSGSGGGNCGACHGGGGGGGDDGGGGGGGIITTSILGATGARKTESGLGDITLSGRVLVIHEEEYIPAISVNGRVKFPTADDSRGLGTGEFDEGFGIEVSKGITNDLIGYLDGGFTIVGEPSGSTLKNQWSYDAGLGYYITDEIFGSVFYEESTAIAPGGLNPRSASLSLDFTPIPWLRVNAGGFVGLSNGSADHGVNGGVSIRF